ncbi:MAG: serine hydrolase [Bacteroidota bacterium]
MKQLTITILCFICLSSCRTKEVPSSTYTKEINEVTYLLDSTDLGTNFNGTILIADGPSILFKKAYGSNQKNEPNQIDTKYGLASMGKMFTSISILQLQENGQLSLDQTIGAILTDYPNNEAKQITIEQLLSHTSGLGDFFGPEFDKNQDHINSLSDILPYFVSDPLEFKPGERMRYSNAGFIVLGLIIEETTGIDYNTYVTNHILEPTGMTATGPLTSSAGGGDTTVDDIYKFALALKNQKLISPESFEKATTDRFDNGYGYGMSLRQINDKIVYGHNGGAPGVSGELDMVMKENLIIISLSNRSPMDGWAQVRTNIRKTFFGSTPEITEFLNTEEVMKTYAAHGYERASDLLAELDNNISDRNTFSFAEKFAMQGKPDKAIDILKLIVQAYPDQWYPYNFLADFQLQAGLKEEAIKNYKISLQINPENAEVIEKINNLEQGQ